MSETTETNRSSRKTRRNRICKMGHLIKLLAAIPIVLLRLLSGGREELLANAATVPCTAGDQVEAVGERSVLGKANLGLSVGPRSGPRRRAPHRTGPRIPIDRSTLTYATQPRLAARRTSASFWSTPAATSGTANQRTRSAVPRREIRKPMLQQENGNAQTSTTVSSHAPTASPGVLFLGTFYGDHHWEPVP